MTKDLYIEHGPSGFCISNTHWKTTRDIIDNIDYIKSMFHIDDIADLILTNNVARFKLKYDADGGVELCYHSKNFS